MMMTSASNKKKKNKIKKCEGPHSELEGFFFGIVVVGCCWEVC